MLIEEGSKAIVYNLSHDSHGGVITIDRTFELKNKTILMDNEYLCCVDSVVKNNDGLIVIKVYEQDAVIIKGDILYKTISDAF